MLKVTLFLFTEIIINISSNLLQTLGEWHEDVNLFARKFFTFIDFHSCKKNLLKKRKNINLNLILLKMNSHIKFN